MCMEDALAFGYEFQLEARAQRRPRSSDGEADEEAKRICTDPPLPQRDPRARGGMDSPTFAEATRRTNAGGSAIPTDATPAAAPAQVDSAAPAAPTQKGKEKRPRYPPLVVERLPNWAFHFRAVNAKLGHPPNARPYQGGIRFVPESEEEYRVVQRYLTDLERSEGLSWFSYSLPAERSLKVAIRGLPADTDPKDIEEELGLLGYEPEYVCNINARGGRPGCIFHAVLRRQPDIRRIYDTTMLLCMRGVRVEAWRSKRGPAQCHRCQKFRHSFHQCHRPLACVRCGGEHAARDCPRPRTEPATGANCAGDHPACSNGCPVKKKEALNKRAGTVAITTRQRRPREGPTTTTNTDEHEAPSATLMATANGPTQKNAASRRRKKGRGRRRRGKNPQPPATHTEQGLDPVVAQAQVTSTATCIKKPTDAAAGASNPRKGKRAGNPAPPSVAPPAAAQPEATGKRPQQQQAALQHGHPQA